MEVTCKMNAYDLITGERRFTKNCTYIAKIVNDNAILALDDKGEWSTISTMIGTKDLFSNEVFNAHFKAFKEDSKWIS